MPTQAGKGTFFYDVSSRGGGGVGGVVANTDTYIAENG